MQNEQTAHLPSTWPCEAAEPQGATAAEVAGLAPACSLATAELSSRKAALRADFMPRIVHRQKIALGCIYWFERNEQNMRLVSEFALYESACCGFLSFGIGLHPQGKLISLRITGPDGAPEFLREAETGLEA